jgi:hypothetical protein
MPVRRTLQNLAQGAVALHRRQDFVPAEASFWPLALHMLAYLSLLVLSKLGFHPCKPITGGRHETIAAPSIDLSRAADPACLWAYAAHLRPVQADYLQGFLLLAVRRWPSCCSMYSPAWLPLVHNFVRATMPVRAIRLSRWPLRRDRSVLPTRSLALFPHSVVRQAIGYATMEGGREHVRHISDMCWVLPPIGLLCVKSKWLRNALIAIGICFRSW